MRIVIADEHDNFRGVLVEALRDDGHDVHGAAHGGELVTLVRRVRPDAIITHSRFTDLSALEALEYLTREGLAVPTILMSGDIRGLPVEEAEALGVVAFLEKPFSLEQLRSTIRQIMSARPSAKLRAERSRSTA